MSTYPHYPFLRPSHLYWPSSSCQLGVPSYFLFFCYTSCVGIHSSCVFMIPIAMTILKKYIFIWLTLFVCLLVGYLCVSTHATEYLWKSKDNLFSLFMPAKHSSKSHVHPHERFVSPKRPSCPDYTINLKHSEASKNNFLNLGVLLSVTTSM